MTEKFIASEDIFLKAAIRHAERIGLPKNEWLSHAHGNRSNGYQIMRNELADLHERIAALKDVGAL